MTNPLIITKDQALLDELARLAAAAGVAPDVVTEPAQALRSWSSAPVVLVGADLAGELAAIEPGRRQGLHLVGWGQLPDELFRAASSMGIDKVSKLPQTPSWFMSASGKA